jgi:hypothetical protein
MIAEVFIGAAWLYACWCDEQRTRARRDLAIERRRRMGAR